MPIKIMTRLPAREILEKENIFVMTDERAVAQDIRPLSILILNLMPTKVDTETQLLRLLSNTPLQVEIQLLQMATHISKNTSAAHLLDFYQTFDDIKDKSFDGMIITGAPVERLEYEEVDYWEELCSIMEWSKTHVYSVFHICWGAQAGLYYHYKVPKYNLDKKLSGVYMHTVEDTKHPLVRGFNDRFYAPHSRYTEVRRGDIEKHNELIVLANSPEAGVYIAANKNGRQFFVMGHSEYDRGTLAKEYFRDINKGIEPDIPCNYFPEDNPGKKPMLLWRAHASLLFSNWLNYFVYQQTPYDLKELMAFTQKPLEE